MSASDPEVLVDQVSDLSSAKETILFWGFLFIETDLLLELRILDDLVQSRSNLRVQHLEVWKVLSTNWSRGFQFLAWINHLHFFDPHRLSLDFWNLIFQMKNDWRFRNLSNCSSDSCCLCCPTIRFCGISTGIDELIVDRAFLQMSASELCLYFACHLLWKKNP